MANPCIGHLAFETTDITKLERMTTAAAMATLTANSTGNTRLHVTINYLAKDKEQQGSADPLSCLYVCTIADDPNVMDWDHDAQFNQYTHAVQHAMNNVRTTDTGLLVAERGTFIDQNRAFETGYQLLHQTHRGRSRLNLSLYPHYTE